VQAVSLNISTREPSVLSLPAWVVLRIQMVKLYRHRKPADEDSDSIRLRVTATAGRASQRCSPGANWRGGWTFIGDYRQRSRNDFVLLAPI